MYRVIQLAVVLFTYDQGRLLVIWHWLSHKVLHIFFTTSVKKICELFFYPALGQFMAYSVVL